MHIVSGYWLWVICATINSFCRAHYQGCRGAECYHLVLCVTAGDVWLCDAEWDHTLWFVTLSPRPPPASQLQMGLLVTSRSSRCTSRSISGALLAILTSFELYPSLFFGCHSHRYAYFGSPRIILRRVPSWFKAVLALAILPWCARGGLKRPSWDQKWPNKAGLPMSQSGLRGSKMIPNDQYNMFLTIWGPFGPT